MPITILLDQHKLDRIDQTADLIADFGHESYYELYERFKHLGDLHVFVAKLDAEADRRLHVGDQVAFVDETDAVYQVLDLLKDHTSGEHAGVSPGRLAILQMVRGEDGEDPAGAGMQFVAAEPTRRERRDRARRERERRPHRPDAPRIEAEDEPAGHGPGA